MKSDITVCPLCGHIKSNKLDERDCKKILSFIEKNESVTKGMLYRRFHAIYPRATAIIEKLVDDKIIEHIKVKKGNNVTNVYRHYISKW